MSVVREASAPFLPVAEAVLESPRPYRLSADHFEALVDSGLLEGVRVELLEGELIEMPAQHMPHMRAKMHLIFALKAAISDAGLELEVGAEASVRLGPDDVPEPDVFIYEDVGAEKACPASSVRLAAEVCRTTHEIDLVRKPAIYARGGLPEYWIVDLRARAVTVMWSPQPDGYAEGRTVPFGGELAASTLPVAITTQGLG